jgi:hypothetical protein
LFVIRLFSYLKSEYDIEIQISIFVFAACFKMLIIIGRDRIFHKLANPFLCCFVV